MLAVRLPFANFPSHSLFVIPDSLITHKSQATFFHELIFQLRECYADLFLYPWIASYFQRCEVNTDGIGVPEFIWNSHWNPSGTVFQHGTMSSRGRSVQKLRFLAWELPWEDHREVGNFAEVNNRTRRIRRRILNKRWFRTCVVHGRISQMREWKKAWKCLGLAF